MRRRTLLSGLLLGALLVVATVWIGIRNGVPWLSRVGAGEDAGTSTVVATEAALPLEERSRVVVDWPEGEQARFELVVRVVDGQDQPVPDAAVRVAWSDGRSISEVPRARTTDSEGTVPVRLDLEPDVLWLRVQAPGWARNCLEVLPPFPSEAIVRLERGLDLRGTVREAEGLPVEGAAVVLEARLGIPWVEDPPHETVRTDAEGRFELSGVALGAYVVRVRATGYARWAREVEWHQGPLDPLEIELTREQILAGSVHDENGQPLAGAVVQARLSGRTALGAWRAESSPDGSFEVRGLRAGDLQAWVSKEGYAAWSRAIRMPHPEPLDVVLTAPGTLTGTVWTPSRRPYEIRVASLDGGLERRELLEEPEFRLEGLAAGMYEVRVHPHSAAERSWGQVEIVPGSVQDLGSLSFLDGAEVLGRAVSAEDGAPVSVTAILYSRQPPHHLWDRVAETASDEHGYFRFTGIGPGTHKVDLWRGVHAETDEFDVPEGSTVDLGDVPIERGCPLEIEALGRDGLPLAFGSLVVYSGTTLTQTSLDPAGMRRIEAVLPGEVVASFTIDGITYDIPFEASCPGPNHLRFDARELPEPPIWTARVVDGDRPPRARNISAHGDGWYTEPVPINSDGSFRLRGVQPGPIKVRIEPDLGESGWVASFEVEVVDEHTPAVIYIPQGQLRGALVPARENVKVWVTRLKEGETADSIGTDVRGRTSLAITDKHGEFILARVLPGRYAIEAEWIGAEKVTVTLAEGQHVEVELRAP